MIESPTESELAVVRHAVEIVAGMLGLADPVALTFVTPLESAQHGGDPRYIFEIAAGEQRAALALQASVIAQARSEDVNGRLARQEIERLIGEALGGFEPGA